jgi:AraC-like DNA-binding protein
MVLAGRLTVVAPPSSQAAGRHVLNRSAKSDEPASAKQDAPLLGSPIVDAPILGQAFGAYHERAALPALRPHFANVWFHVVPRDASGKSAIVPDGCADLIWYDGGLCVAGPDRQAKIETVAPGTTVVGLRFRPGAARHWLGVAVSELVDTRPALECFWGARARRLAQEIGEASTAEGIARQIETALAQRVADIGTTDDIASAIFQIVGQRRDYSIAVTHRLQDDLGLSERTLRRRCHEAFGYGPKTLDRILRFQRFLALARMPTPVGMAELAADAGYADQSHLTRETRELAGLTPGNIRAQFAG